MRKKKASKVVRKRAPKARAKTPVISNDEVENIRRKIAGDKESISDLDGPREDDPGTYLPVESAVNIDRGAIRKRIKRNEKALAVLDPNNRRLTGHDRQKGEKRYFELKEILVSKMLTRQQMDAFPSTADPIKDALYHEACNRACGEDSENSPRFIQMAEEFKELARLLWPEDPTMCDMEKIRPFGDKVTGRHFAK